MCAKIVISKHMLPYRLLPAKLYWLRHMPLWNCAREAAFLGRLRQHRRRVLNEFMAELSVRNLKMVMLTDMNSLSYPEDIVWLILKEVIEYRETFRKAWFMPEWYFNLLIKTK